MTERRTGEGLSTEQILRTAADLFAEMGYRATNLQHVSARLGVTRQALYYYFPRKHDILMALFDVIMTQLECQADRTIGEDPPERFLALLRGHAHVVASNISLVTVLLTESAEIREPLHPEAADRRRAYTRRLREAYLADVKAGRLRVVSDPSAAVNTAISAVNGLYRWYDAAGPSNPVQIAELVTDLLGRGLVPAESSTGGASQ